jgi:hypothetical protein
MSRVLSSDGRWLVTPPLGYKGKTYIGNRYVFEYRLIMEKHINRLLKPYEQIHHINGNKLDDRFENLEILNKSDHQKLHGEWNKGKLNTYCAKCQKQFHVRPCKLKQNKAIFCSRICYKKYVKLNNWGKRNIAR